MCLLVLVVASDACPADCMAISDLFVSLMFVLVRSLLHASHTVELSGAAQLCSVGRGSMFVLKFLDNPCAFVTD